MPASKSLYEAVAATIKSHIENESNYRARKALCLLAGELAIDFKDDNMHFQTGKFLTACGM